MFPVSQVELRLAMPRFYLFFPAKHSRKLAKATKARFSSLSKYRILQTQLDLPRHGKEVGQLIAVTYSDNWAGHVVRSIFFSLINNLLRIRLYLD